jgi:hypothetical protein
MTSTTLQTTRELLAEEADSQLPAAFRVEREAASRAWKLFQDRRLPIDEGEHRLRTANASMCECERRLMRFVDTEARFQWAIQRSRAAIAASLDILGYPASY